MAYSACMMEDHNIYGLLLTKCEVKRVRYWPSSFCVFNDLDSVSVDKLPKEERGQYTAIMTGQA